MAIRIIEGVPGAGKTYYVVHHVSSNYCTWDDTLDAFVLRPGVRLYTNISQLRVGEDLDHSIQQAGGLAKFFTVTHMQSVVRQVRASSDDARVVFIIDEAQRYFDRRFFNKDVFLFFQWHRHLGLDVYLVTQDVKSLALELRALAEYYVRARRRTFTVFGEFKYDFLGSEGGESFSSKVLRRDQRVFAMYRSMMAVEGESVRSATLRKAVLAVGLLTVGVGMAWFSVHKISGGRWSPWSTAEAVPAATEVKHDGSSARPGGATPGPAAAVAGSPAASTFVPVRVIGLAGGAGFGSVILEGDDGGQRRYPVSEVSAMCSCDPFTLRLGSLLSVHRSSAPAPARARSAGAGDRGPAFSAAPPAAPPPTPTSALMIPQAQLRPGERLPAHGRPGF